MSEQVMKIKIDSSEVAGQLGEVLHGALGYELESAIASTVALLADDPGKWVFDRLSAHLDALLAEQRDLVSSWKNNRHESFEHVNP